MIDPKAVIDPTAKLGANVSVGPYTVIGPDVEIGDDTWIGPHVVIRGPTRIGRGNRIFQFASVGEDPQDKKYKGEPTLLEIGDGNVIREFVTMHRGTEKGGGVTRIGNDNLFMAYSHVAHDCQIGNRVIMANAATLAGHVVVEDGANIAGLAAIHQFIRIGRHAMVGGGSIVVLDVPPFTMAAGNHARLYGLNVRGLRRAGISAESIAALKQAYRLLYRSGLGLAAACERIRHELPPTPELAHLLDFIERTQRGLTR